MLRPLRDRLPGRERTASPTRPSPEKTTTIPAKPASGSHSALCSLSTHAAPGRWTPAVNTLSGEQHVTGQRSIGWTVVMAQAGPALEWPLL